MGIGFDLGVKPEEWDAEVGLVAPEWEWAWEGLKAGYVVWEGGGSTIFNVAGNSFDGALGSGVSWGTGEFNPQLNFPGSDANSTVNLGDLDLVAPLTIVWLGQYSSVTSGDEQTVFGKRDAGAAGVTVGLEESTNSNVSRLYYDSGGFQLWRTTVQPLTANQNHHQVWSYDGATDPTFYADAIPYATTYDIGSGYPAVLANAVEAKIGNIVSPTSEPLIGNISLMLIYEGVAWDGGQVSFHEADSFGMFRMTDEVGAVIVPDVVAGGRPQGPFGHPFHGPMAGPVGP